TGPLVSPALTSASWESRTVPIHEADHLLLYTDGVSETLADANGQAEARFAGTIAAVPHGGAALLDAILADIDRELVGQPQPDDLTLLTAGVISSSPEHCPHGALRETSRSDEGAGRRARRDGPGRCRGSDVGAAHRRRHDLRRRIHRRDHHHRVRAGGDQRSQ